jgi:ankyrin repeat protein
MKTRIYFKFIAYLFVITGFVSAHAQSYVEFFRAVNVDNASTVTELLARGFDPNTRSESGQVALYLAMREDAPKVAAALLASPGLDVDATNAAGETPLMMAALKGRLEWAKKLIDRGAKVQKPGWSPVHYAATGPNTELLAMLLDRGADINALAPNRNTPLMMAARYGSEDNVKLLLQRGADKKPINDRNLSAADMAKAGERPWLVPLLQ